VYNDHQNIGKIPIYSSLELENFDVGGVYSTHRYIRNSYIILIGKSENCNTSEIYVPRDDNIKIGVI
jgi:hypothetical protein